LLTQIILTFLKRKFKLQVDSPETTKTGLEYLHLKLQNSDKKECFSYRDRNEDSGSDNLVNYTAGPANIFISPWTKELVVSMYDPNWDFLLDNLRETVVEAWELTDNDYVLEDSAINIKLNYKIILLYLEYKIIYYDY